MRRAVRGDPPGGRSGLTTSGSQILTPAGQPFVIAGVNWGTGDGIDPAVNPNPNAFSPACVATSTCRDWRLAAQRAGNRILGAALSQGWSYPLIFVEGVSQTPAAGGTVANGPYDGYAITTNSWSGLANPRKLYTFLCAIQQTPPAQCGSTGALPPPE